MREDARLYGQVEAERFDLELRQQEQREREARLSRFALGADEEDPTVTAWARPAADGSHLVWRLQQDVERLASFHRAVLGSRAWRLIQLARRPFGRSW